MQENDHTAIDFSQIIITDALPADAQAIYELLTPNVKLQSVLPRTVEDIEIAIHSFKVARFENRVVGCVALKPYGNGLYEIRSLVVKDDIKGQGVGSKLICAILDYARCLRAREVFTLTVRPHLFERLLFSVLPKENIVQKVWNDCANCPKKDKCDEVALIKQMNW